MITDMFVLITNKDIFFINYNSTGRFTVFFFFFRNKDVQFMITTGSGKFFSNGLDLDFISKCSPKEALETLNGLPSLLLRLLTFPVPAIAALNGTVCIF